MKTSSEGFQQCYNAQVAVDGERERPGRAAALSEAPHGWIKHVLGFRRFSLRIGGAEPAQRPASGKTYRATAGTD